MSITITEALAEIPTIDKRIAKKQEFILSFLYRQSAVRDPHEKDGGVEKVILQEMQSIADLKVRKVQIRTAIQQANLVNTLTISNQTRTISEWLTWRREVAPMTENFLNQMAQKLNQMRAVAHKEGVAVKDKDEGAFTKDFIVHYNEKLLAEERDALEQVLGLLDGQLSLKNATILLEI